MNEIISHLLTTYINGNTTLLQVLKSCFGHHIIILIMFWASYFYDINSLQFYYIIIHVLNFSESWIGTDRITLEKKKAQLSDLHLLHFSKALNPAHLNIIGTSFEFSQVDVQNIEYKHNRAPEAASHDLLVKWRNKKGNSATVGCLLENMLKSYEAFPQSIHEEKVRDAVDRL